MPRHPQGILVSCELPWDEQERLIESVFRQEIRYFAEAGFRQLYVFGTAGEGYAVDGARFRQVVEIFLDECRNAGVSAQVGVIGLSTPVVVERIQAAWELGCRSFQISLPCWGALDDTELREFFRVVCGSFPDAGFLHYNLPRAKRVLGASDYRRLVDENPNLVATKNTGTSVLETRALITEVPELQHHLGEAMFPAGCSFGECSLLSSFGPLLPRQTRELFEYGRNGRWELLMPHWKRYMDVIGGFLKSLHGVPRMDGAYDKMIVRMSGVPMPLRLISPYQGYTEDHLTSCAKALAAIDREWFENWSVKLP